LGPWRINLHLIALILLIFELYFQEVGHQTKNTTMCVLALIGILNKKAEFCQGNS